MRSVSSVELEKGLQPPAAKVPVYTLPYSSRQGGVDGVERIFDFSWTVRGHSHCDLTYAFV